MTPFVNKTKTKIKSNIWNLVRFMIRLKGEFITINKHRHDKPWGVKREHILPGFERIRMGGRIS